MSGSYCLGFDPQGSGDKVWNDLKRQGELMADGTSLPKTRKFKRKFTKFFHYMDFYGKILFL